MIFQETDQFQPTNGTYETRRLLPRHYQIIDLALAGHSNLTIAKTVGMTPQAVGYILRSPLVQAEMIRRRQESDFTETAAMDRQAILGKARSILEGSLERAAETQVGLLESEDHSIKLRASNAILDRVFGKAEDSKPTVVNISAENVQLLNLALKESFDVKHTE